jgi:hypothetical protein
MLFFTTFPVLTFFLFLSFLITQRYVDGWLGIMVGQQLWHPMYDESAVAKTASVIKGLIGDGAPRIVDRRSSLVMLDVQHDHQQQQQQQQQASTPQMQQQRPSNANLGSSFSMTAMAELSWEVEVWALLTNPVKAKDAAALSAYLTELGVTDASELLEFDEAEVGEIAAFLKKHPKKKLLKIYRYAMAKA